MTDFPVLKINSITRFIIYEGVNKKDSFNKFRMVSSNFIKRKEVRLILLNKFENKCVICSTNKGLQIDHIKSVKKCFITDTLDYCNTFDNLQVLCVKCNTSKKP